MENQEEGEAELRNGLLKAEDRGGRMIDDFPNDYGDSKGPEVRLSRGGEEKWGETGSPRGGLIATLLLVGLVISILGCLVAMMMMGKKGEEMQVESPSTDAVVPSVGFLERASQDEIKKATLDAVRGFMNATTNEERCRYLLGGESMVRTLDEFYSREDAAYLSSGFGKIQSSESAVFDGEIVIIALAVESSGKRAWAYSLFAGEENDMKIDWMTSVSYGEMNWPRFLKEKPRKPVQMRVYLKRLAGFQATRHNPDEYDAFEVTAYGYPVDQVEILYVAKGSDEGEDLAKCVGRGGGARHPVNLSLSWGGERPVLQLEEVIHNLWTAPSGD